MISAQVLTAQEMRAAEKALFDTGSSVSQLMEIAAGGAAEWIRRVAADRSVTVLCGPGNNGGDGYVIARRLREAGNALRVVAPLEPVTDAGREARARWGANVCVAGEGAHGEVFVDCLFGSGLTRPLSGEHAALLGALAASHSIRVAVDLPSGVATDSGAVLNESLPDYHLTLALGAWKFAHWSLPGRLKMGQLRLVPIGIAEVTGAAQLIDKPQLAAPSSVSHKYRRGLLAVVAGAMPGAGLLAAAAAQRAGAGYVKLLGDAGQGVPPELVQVGTPLRKALADERIAAVLVGPGLGRDELARERLAAALAASHPLILDADALVLLSPGMLPQNRMTLATPHDGELAALAHSFGVSAASRRETASLLARVSGMVIIGKGPDTVIAAPDGRVAVAPPASSWLSVAGTGDVLAGIAASRMACGRDPFIAACEAVWLHGEAARRVGVAFTPSALAEKVPQALAAAL
jgi:ADP-dependent NAD(P)H-hydrate dehydratase / NAD(P)H-hydrate epimerase